MAWTQLIIDLGGVDPEPLSDRLMEWGAVSVSLEDAGDQPLLEPAPGETPMWGDVRLKALFALDVDMEEVRARIGLEWDAALLQRTRAEALEDRDWVRAWMDTFHPMRFGERLWVCPSHHAPPDPHAVNLLLDPGLAFGTGTHPTTALCLEWLDAQPPTGARVLDFGCGSGILAIAAARLGAAEVHATDIDPQALEATRDNAERNGVAEQLQICLPQALPSVQFDLVLANILANPLIDLAEDLAARVVPGGRIVLSGILREQADAVNAAYAALFRMDAPVIKGDWVRLAGARSNTVPE